MSSKSAPGCSYSQVADCSAFVEQWASRCEAYVRLTKDLTKLSNQLEELMKSQVEYPRVINVKDEFDDIYAECLRCFEKACSVIPDDAIYDRERSLVSKWRKDMIGKKVKLEQAFDAYLQAETDAGLSRNSNSGSHESRIQLLELQFAQVEMEEEQELERINIEKEKKLLDIEQKERLWEAKKRSLDAKRKIKEAMLAENRSRSGASYGSRRYVQEKSVKAPVLLEPTGISTTDCKLDCKGGEVDQNFVADARKPLVQELKPTFEKLMAKSSQPHVGQMSLIGQCPLVGPALNLPSLARCQGSMVESSKKEDLSLRKGQSIVEDVQCTLAEAIREARFGYSRPKVEIEKFDGNPLKYFQFMHRFDAHVESCYKDNGRKLDLMFSLCIGEAHRAIEGCLYLPCDVGYPEARKRLEERFGQKPVIVEAYVDKLTSGPPIRESDSKAICALADEAFNCFMTLKGWDCAACLNLQENIRKVYSRFPLSMRERFDDICCLLYKKDNLPTFENLVNFLQNEAARSNSYLKRQHQQVAAKERQSVSRFNMPRKHNRVNTVSAKETRRSFGSANAPSTSRGIKCADCGQDHPLWQCDSFKKKSVAERKAVVKKGPCINCLSSLHQVAHCNARFCCKICGKRHHTLLHDPPGNNSDQSAAATQEQPSSSGIVAFSYRNKRNLKRVKRFKVVPVRVSGGNSEHATLTYAFMDDGSDSSLCAKSLAKRLNLSESSRSCELVTTNATSNHKVLSDTLRIQGINELNSFSFKEVILVDKITDVSQSIPTKEVAKLYSHLSDIEFPEINTDEVELLLGNDVHEAFRITEQRCGEYGEPFGLHTALGWTLFGSDYSDNAREETCLSASDDVIRVQFLHKSDAEDECNQILEIMNQDFMDLDEDYGVKPSVEDKLTVEKMEKSLKKVGNHYQVGLPWKEDHPVLPTNKAMALRRLNYLKRRFEKDPELYRNYKEKMQEYLELGYAQRVTEDAEEVKDPIWYIPHHNTGSKFRIVFDCAAKAEGCCLNDKLLSGPDQTSSLLGVLLRFREEQVAFVADIKAMFLQVLVDPRDRNALRFLWWPEHNTKALPVDYQMNVHIFGATSSPSVAGFALRKAAQDNLSSADEATISTVHENFYVDDLLKSVTTIKEAIELISQLRDLLSSGGFHLTKFLSNQREVVDSVPPDCKANSLQDISFNELPTEKNS